ncbi:acetyl-CoA acetyltransferase [Sporomusa aerivorans]|uniref:acetyl-CoA acetyltransferase n=1 Tax=Sporomusa aerivorans TaxID=204936 RepID=UPI00352AB68D
MSIKDQIAIAGMGCSKFGERWDCGVSDLVVESSYEAYEDAGVGPKDIQAVFVGQMYAPVGGLAGAQVIDALKLKNIPVIRNENWCCAGHVALISAIMAVASGAYDVVMAIGVEKLKDTGFPGLGAGRGMNPVYEARRTAPGSFSLIATRYFEQYGLTLEEGKQTIGKIAVKNHKNGMLAPKAHFHKEITLEEVIKAPIISSPLGLYDCCGNSDGSACAIITRADTARKLREDPIYVKGFGISMDTVLPHTRPGFSWTSFDALKTSSAKAYEMAGIRNPRTEIDVAEVHDCFTITEMLIYEDFGFSARGKAKEDIDEGFFELNGGLPVNVDGGLKCFGHPVGASGLRMTYEIYKQLQYKVDNPQRQIKDVSRGLSHTFGGGPQLSCVFIAGNEPG